MFNFFKRTKIENWEINLLRNTIQLLPEEYQRLKEQIDDKLLKGVLIGFSDLPGYVAFTYNSKLVRKFENGKDKDYKLSGINILDNISNRYLQYSIFVSTGTISGYSIEGAKKFSIDVKNVDVGKFRKEYINNKDYEEIRPILSIIENQVINPGEVYKVILNGKSYFHIKNLEDGDFIGMDDKKNIYKITHDPFEIKPLDYSLVEAMNK